MNTFILDSAATKRSIAPVATFAVLFTALWIGLYFTHSALPYIRPGSELVASMKFDKMSKGAMFTESDRVRVLSFGNSRTLAGFRPEVFDAGFQSGVKSYNLGLPGDTKFLPMLRQALESGNRPTHVLLQLGWEAVRTDPGFLSALKDDKAILKKFIPFRSLPRDAFIFLYAASKGGPRTEYSRTRAEVDLVEAQRGWYFIRSQSHYPNDSLPPDYRLPTDNPGLPYLRNTVPSGSDYAELVLLAAQYNFRVVLVPDAFREGQYRPASAAEAAPPSIVKQVGPAYWLFPAPLFSDPGHLNPGGAKAYTAKLAETIRHSGAFE